MDSYTAALRQVAENQAVHSASTPTWFKSASAATSQPVSDQNTLIEESLIGNRQPPPRPPPRSTLRTRPSFTQLERVVEETASQRSSTNSPVLSTSARSTTSTAESVQTAIYNPRADDNTNGTGGSDSSGNDSASLGSRSSQNNAGAQSSSSDEAGITPATSWTSSNNSPHGTRRESPLKRQLSSLPTATRPRETGQSAAATRYRSQLSETAPAPAVPRENESEEPANHPKVTSHLKSAAHALASKLKPGKSDHAEEQQARYEPHDDSPPVTEAINGMIEELGPPSENLRRSKGDMYKDTTGPIYRARTPQYPIHQRPPQQPDRSGPKTFETVRDGVSIQMREKNGVWVEAVEGAELTSTQDQQQNMPKSQPIAEREAEDVPEITIPEDPWNNLPPYIKLEYGTAESSRPISQRPDTRSRRQQATASWAQDQASLQHDPQPQAIRRRDSTSGSPSSSSITPWETQFSQQHRPRRRTMDSSSPGAPFYYDKGKIRHNESHQNSLHQVHRSDGSSNFRSCSDKPSGSDSSPNTSLTTQTTNSPPPRNPRRNAPNFESALDMQQRIANSASAVEQFIYTLPPSRVRGQPSRFESIQLD